MARKWWSDLTFMRWLTEIIVDVQLRGVKEKTGTDDDITYIADFHYDSVPTQTAWFYALCSTAIALVLSLCVTMKS